MPTEIVNGRNASGNTQERPSNVDAGFNYYNTETGKLQTFTGSDWVDIGGPGAVAPSSSDDSKSERRARKK